ncbi:hypothetical protein BUE76_09680 [Cnuella takakiae]|nr:hypothetical protein BUE76_09680 [Cnuella takakiae]
MAMSCPLWAQDQDLLRDVAPDKTAKTPVGSAFKSSRVIMSQSIEMLKPGVLDFRILHRFGNVNQGAKEFFGLDQATIRLGFDYGISRNLTVGIGRGSYRKELDGFVKGKLLQQQLNGSPLSVVLVGGATLITAPWAVENEKYRFGHRMAYFTQLLAGSKFSDAFSLQLMPTYLHRNLVPTATDRNNLFAAGVGGRLKVSKRSSINFDYYLVAGKPAGRYNPLSLGVDIETGGHVFQLHLTNAVGMNERVFLTETTNSWGKGDIQIGFNISRAFQVGKKREVKTKW